MSGARLAWQCLDVNRQCGLGQKNNRKLKGIYARAHDHAKTLSAIERVMLIHPAAEELRDRGLVLAALHRYPQAIADLESYLRTKPEPEEAKAIQEKLKELKQRQAQWN